MGLVQLAPGVTVRGRPRRVVFGFALVTTAVLGACGDSHDPPQPQERAPASQPISTTAPRSTLALSVTQRARTRDDELPRYAEESAGADLGGYEVDPDESRYVGERQGVRLYVVPGPRDVCLFTADGAGGCATQAQALEGGLVGAQIGPPLLAEGEVRIWGTVPDGPTEVSASFEEGPDETVLVADNVWVIRTHRTLNSVSWQSAEASGSVEVPAF